VVVQSSAAELPESRKRLSEFSYTQHRDAKVKSNSNLVLITFHSEQGLLKNRKVKIAFASKTYTIQTDSNGMYRQTLAAGKYPFGAWLDDSHEEIKTDSLLYPGGHRTEITLWFYSSIERVICDKPVVYVYCDSAQEIQLGLKVDGQLLFSYPTYTAPLPLKQTLPECSNTRAFPIPICFGMQVPRYPMPAKMHKTVSSLHAKNLCPSSKNRAKPCISMPANAVISLPIGLHV
jgi:hypothetical protein